MKSILDRLTKLETVVNPPAIEPLILYGHWTAEQCAVLNAKRNPVNNPLFFECRPVAERGEA
ncbi:MAG: hypothetical protein ACYDH8_14390 [Syntrophales bacterium]